MSQSEQQLENTLLNDLIQLGYERVELRSEKLLLANLKTQLEKVNGLHCLSPNEWQQLKEIISKGTPFDKADRLRDGFVITLDDGTPSKHIRLLFAETDKNIYQVTNQITVDARKNNKTKTSRFDVTILINGLPLVQMELKKRGVEIAEAFNQTLRYTKEAYWAGNGLFHYIQLFVISNGANTRYYANGTKEKSFIFQWTDEFNNPINELRDFTPAFLTPQHVSDMINKYMLLNSEGFLMVLRPYQVYAVEKIVQQVQTSDKNGYIWHTTGAGKTLTSFQASTVIQAMPEVAKVLFVVDRKDLNSQTLKEFNNFTGGSHNQLTIDDTNDTKQLVKQLKGKHKLIITTIQKLNRAVTKDKYLQDIAYLQDKKVVLIFDECHRSQFGETHKRIKAFFQKSQMFGFTGTPIFADNSVKKGSLELTTDYLFDELLHKYMIVDAIRDKNVLPFRIDYHGKFTTKDTANNDEEVEAINTKEAYENKGRLQDISQFIINNHDKYSKNRQFTALFCVSSIDVLIEYYQLFKELQKQKQKISQEEGRLYTPLKIATIFSAQNDEENAEDNKNNNNSDDINNSDEKNTSRLSQLESYIKDYNQTFATTYNAGNKFDEYYRDIAKRINGQEHGKTIEKIDILIVVNMFLTGFNASLLNTLYVDKNLKQHGLIQAFSRTNRLYGSQKPFGNIVCFRNLKQVTDEALFLFSQDHKNNEVFVPAYEDLKAHYDKAVNHLKSITEDYKAVDTLVTEEQQAEFIKAFRDVMRMDNQLKIFVEYDQNETALTKEEFDNFTSKYKDLKDSITDNTDKEKVSILADIDFQLELLHRDDINVGYIISLLQHVVDSDSKEKQENLKQQAIETLYSDISLHNKKELIQKFIDENMPKLINGTNVSDAFYEYWEIESNKERDKLCDSEKLVKDKFDEEIIGKYQVNQHIEDIGYSQITKIIDNDKRKLGFLNRASELEIILKKTHQFINTFYEGMPSRVKKVVSSAIV